MSEIMNQTERAVAKVLEFSKDSDVYVCGHSAGGHLAAMLLFTDFEKKFNVSSKNIKGLIPVSGVFDLSPILKTDINDNLKMNEKESSWLSPMLRKDPILCKDTKFLIAYAENDSPAFHKQSHEFEVWLKKNDYEKVKCIQIAKSDHFDIIENISQDDFSLTKVFINFKNKIVCKTSLLWISWIFSSFYFLESSFLILNSFWNH